MAFFGGPLPIVPTPISESVTPLDRGHAPFGDSEISEIFLLGNLRSRDGHQSTSSSADTKAPFPRDHSLGEDHFRNLRISEKGLSCYVPTFFPKKGTSRSSVRLEILTAHHLERALPPAFLTNSRGFGGFAGTEESILRSTYATERQSSTPRAMKRGIPSKGTISDISESPKMMVERFKVPACDTMNDSLVRRRIPATYNGGSLAPLRDSVPGDVPVRNPRLGN